MLTAAHSVLSSLRSKETKLTKNIEAAKEEVLKLEQSISESRARVDAVRTEINDNANAISQLEVERTENIEKLQKAKADLEERQSGHVGRRKVSRSLFYFGFHEFLFTFPLANEIFEPNKYASHTSLNLLHPLFAFSSLLVFIFSFIFFVSPHRNLITSRKKLPPSRSDRPLFSRRSRMSCPVIVR